MNLRETINEVLCAIIPITITMIILQVLLLEVTLSTMINFGLGILIIMVGFTLFLIGVKKSLLPVGELIGASLMMKSKLWFVIVFGILIGFAVTMAEPGVQVLAREINNVSEEVISNILLVTVISLGVGIFLGLAMLRTIFKIPIHILIIGGYLLILILSFFSSLEFIGFAFDAGGVTTGIMTVPFILALGIGMSSVKGSKKSSHESFGFVALASIGPILGMLLLGVLLR